MARTPEIRKGLPISDEDRAAAWQLLEHIAPHEKDNFMLAFEKGSDTITAFIVSKDRSDPESENEVEFLFGEDLKDVLERVARIDQKSEDLRAITEANSEKLKQLERLSHRAEDIIRRIGGKLDIAN